LRWEGASVSEVVKVKAVSPAGSEARAWSDEGAGVGLVRKDYAQAIARLVRCDG
jgi:hypothetical protein